jgi:hypothetical protein
MVFSEVHLFGAAIKANPSRVGDAKSTDLSS